MDEFDENNLAAEVGEMSDDAVLTAFQEANYGSEREAMLFAEIERRDIW